ncbi:MAG: DUF4384 domain-containing protein [Gemmatimonadota bacterium]
MRSYLPLATFLVGLGVTPGPTPAQAQGFFPGQQIGARVWIENDRDYFRRGDRLDVRFSVSDDAYVAVVHIDSDGNMDFLYPASPWDNEYVRGGRVNTLPIRSGSGWTVRGRAGIGYVYIIASPSPLDFAYFRGRTGSPWDWGYAGRAVRGDPFLAFQQIGRMLVPWSSTPYVDDFYSYYVDGFHRYPSYACSDRYHDSGWGWYPSYSSCGQMDYFLRDYPDYYDTRRYRGDRRGYLGQYDNLDPLHGFKENPDRPAARGVNPRNAQPDLRGGAVERGSASPDAPARGVDRRDPVPARPVPERSNEPDRRAAPERRPSGTAAPEPTRAEPTRAEPEASGRRPAPQAEPAAPASSGRRPARGRP